LSERDARLAAWIERVGPCKLPHAPRGDAFRALVRAIVSQQLSSKAAETIFGRVEALVAETGELSPAAILKLPVERLRGAGLSGGKTSFVRDLSERVDRGALDLSSLARLDDEEAIVELTAVKGVGRWTAQMFLIFELARPDVFAPDDLGLRKGMEKLLRARKPLDKERMLKVARAWAPHRSVASWYLWRIAEARD
jgi:DNA-3-methyladenine glycosylase II